MRTPRTTLILFLNASIHLAAQPNRIEPMRGNVRPGGLLRNDLGRMDGNVTLASMTLLLKSSARQQAELEQLLDAQQDRSSPLYHHWITPDEFADRFGVSPSDVAAITRWLGTQGFTIGNVARSRKWIVFSG